MRLLYFVSGLLIVMAITSCKHGEIKPGELNEQITETGLLGFGIKELTGERKIFSPTPLSNYYYGQLFVKANLYKAAISGADARKLSTYILALFGSEKKQFGITVAPILNGVKFPQIVVFSYKYDSDDNSWKSEITPEYSSPVFLVSDFERIKYEFAYVASDSVDLNITELVSGLISNNADLAPGAWVVSKASAKSIGLATATVDKIVSSVLSKSEESKISGQLEPSIKGDREIVYRVGGNGDSRLADISISTRLFTSLVTGSLISKVSEPTDFNAATPKLDPINNPLNRIKVKNDSGGEMTLGDALKRTGLLRNLVAANNPNEFSSQCRDVIDSLQGHYGLTVFDSLNSMRHILLSTKFSRDSSLFNSGCLYDHELSLLEAMGIPIRYTPPASTVKLDSDTLKKIAGYLKSPIANVGFETDILNIFSETGVRVSSVTGKFKSLPREFSAYHRQDLLRQLGQLRVATSCCWGAGILDGEGAPIHGAGQILFRSLDYQDIYTLELYPPIGGGAVDYVRLRRLEENELSVKTRELLLSPAKSQVEDYKSDVILTAGT
ncbi:hypothetical protein ACUYGA_30230 [Metapseudomonas otitidis]|uniref:hypothetical protein n=1 Tax=Metapseudomonas otitidis TaxID=319939 RepID=UPI0040556E54